jgi:hypothetical protein
MRHRPTVAPIGAPFLALILVAMLGNSGLACACALASLDAPAEAHHGMSGDHAVTGSGDELDCSSSCNGHAVTAPGSKASDASDQRSEKPLPPAVHHHTASQSLVPGLPTQWQYEKHRPALPLSTPVSRSDTLLD